MPCLASAIKNQRRNIPRRLGFVFVRLAVPFFSLRKSCTQSKRLSGCLEDHAYGGGSGAGIQAAGEIRLRETILTRGCDRCQGRKLWSVCV